MPTHPDTPSSSPTIASLQMGMDLAKKQKRASVKGPTCSYSDWIILKDVRVREMQGLQLVLQNARIEYNSVFPVQSRDPVQKEYIRQLEVHQARLQVELNELESLFLLGAIKKKGIWDMLRIRLYSWTVYNK